MVSDDYLVRSDSSSASQASELICSYGSLARPATQPTGTHARHLSDYRPQTISDARPSVHETALAFSMARSPSTQSMHSSVIMGPATEPGAFALSPVAKSTKVDHLVFKHVI